MRKPTVIVGGFAQESNSFTGIPTRLEDFDGRGSELLRGQEILDTHRGVNSVMGGFLEDLEANGVHIVPTIHAHACPGGPLTRHAFETLRDELLEQAARTTDYDAILLFLHGAMVAEGYLDPEGDFLRRLRSVAGDRLIGVVLALHANVTEEMIATTDVTVGFKTYPHVDMAQRGRQAAAAIRELISTGSKFHSSFMALPMLLPSINMRTIDPDSPYTELQQLARTAVDNDPDLIELGLYAGFPYGDVPSHRSSVVAVHRRSQSAADAAALKIAREFWDRRRDFYKSVEPADRAVDRALAAKQHPVVLADVADNPGSGGTGDTAGLLRLLVQHDQPGTFVGIIHDPASTARAFELGEGSVAEFAIGGKINSQHGAPVVARARIQRLSDGDYHCKGPMNYGKLERLGKTALLKVGEVLVAVTEGRSSVNDPAMLEMLGLEIRELRVMALKVKGHFRAAFGDLVAQIIDAEAPGASMTDFTQHDFQHRLTPAFPFEADTAWRP